MGLEQYTDSELQAELRRRRAGDKPDPAFRCERCGEVGYFVGHFSAARFEMQHDQFRRNHRQCLPTYAGGCI